jgi:UDP-N-acetylmuramoylalanine--D-glutamate ligase
LLAVEELAVIGPHNHANASAAAALAALFGVAPGPIAGALRAYRALEHRMEPCGQIDGMRCINDSKATNVDSTLAALAGFAHGVRLILGGRDKHADFTRLLPLLDHRIAAILLIGEASDPIAAALEPTHEVQRCETLECAVDRALAAATAGDTLLLSPACTSFDQYRNFEERGQHFKQLVAARSDASHAPEPGASSAAEPRKGNRHG